MRFVVEHLTPYKVMVCNGPTVIAIVELIHPDVVVAPKVSDNCFLVLPVPGQNHSIVALPNRFYKLEVDSWTRAVVEVRHRNAIVCFKDSNVFAIQLL